VTLKELKEGFKMLKQTFFGESDVENIFNAMDLNQNGFVDYTEFIAGSL
jgi:Ca2+-binding EF-hand superfamily protein